MRKIQIIKMFLLAAAILVTGYGYQYYHWDIAHTPQKECFEYINNFAKNQNEIKITKTKTIFNKDEREVIIIVYEAWHGNSVLDKKRKLLMDVLDVAIDSCENKDYLTNEIKNNLRYQLGIYDVRDSRYRSHLYLARRSIKPLWAP